MDLSNKKQWNLVAFFSVFSLIAVRYLYYGFTYFYQLDDYIQYHNYAQFDGAWKSIISRGLLATRPLAGIGDVTLWSWLFPCMIVGVLVIAALYAASALLFQSVFRKHFHTGWIFIVVYTLLPLGFEGTYWMSASTRIVCGLFFAALSGHLLQRWFDGGKLRCLLWALAMQLLCFGFYEQALVLSITLNVLLGILSYREVGKKAFWSLLAVPNAGLYFAVTSLFKVHSIYSDRLAFVSFKDGYYTDLFLPRLWEQTSQAFLGGGFYTAAKGFVRGARILWADGALWYTLLLLGLCALLFFLVKKDTLRAKRPGSGLVCGFLLFLAPITPFFLIAQTWFSLRSTVMSFVGLALLADVLFGLVFHRVAYRHLFAAAGAAALAFVFCVAGVSELQDYNQTYEKDIQVGKSILEQVDVSDPKERIAVLHVEPSYLDNQNYYYHEHVHGVTESTWALTGLLQYLGNHPHMAVVTPLPSTTFLYNDYNYDTQRIESFDKLYDYDDATGKVTPVTYRKTGERTFDLLLPDGTLCGQILDDAGYGYLVEPKK